jgi:hypothetical protein
MSTKPLEKRIKLLEEVCALPGMGKIQIMDSRNPGHLERLAEHKDMMRKQYPDYSGISAIIINSVSRDN